MGNILKDRKQWHEAEPYFRKAVEIDPDYLNSYLGLGDVLFFQRKLVKAREVCLAAFKVDASSPNAWFLLGQISFKQGNLPEARKHFDEALWRNPSYAAALHSKGLTLFAEKKARQSRGNSPCIVETRPGVRRRPL